MLFDFKNHKLSPGLLVKKRKSFTRRQSQLGDSAMFGESEAVEQQKIMLLNSLANNHDASMSNAGETYHQSFDNSYISNQRSNANSII